MQPIRRADILQTKSLTLVYRGATRDYTDWQSRALNQSILTSFTSVGRHMDVKRESRVRRARAIRGGVLQSRRNGGIVVGVDASRVRSGGGVAHVRGLMSTVDPRMHGVSEVHLWTGKKLSGEVPDAPWLSKHVVDELDHSILREMYWQWRQLPRLVRDANCDVLFKCDAGSVCPSHNAVTFAQNMLPFVPEEKARYGFSASRLRLEILRWTQSRSMRSAAVTIFPTEYARRAIEDSIGPVPAHVIIPLGVDEKFRGVVAGRPQWPTSGPIKCVYVSNAAPYKHQWNVVEACAILRSRGLEIELVLAGGGVGMGQRKLEQSLAEFDPDRRFVVQHEFIGTDAICELLGSSDLFVFASSCETISVTLLEAMASGIPVCSSDRGPMPEVLGDGGTYFNPEDAESIASAIHKVVGDHPLRERRASISLMRSQVFTWNHCANLTWKLLADAGRLNHATS